MERSQEPRTQRPVGQLVADLMRQGSELFREEIALARTELSSTVPQISRYSGMVAAGGAIGYAGFLAIVAAAIILLHAVLPWWVAAFIVGLALAIGGYLLIQSGIDGIKKQKMMPTRTIDSFKGYQRIGRNGDGQAYVNRRGL